MVHILIYENRAIEIIPPSRQRHPDNTMISFIEFIQQQSIDDIDELSIDKFWGSIKDDKWIYVGLEMLEWIGYNSVNKHDNKRHYHDMISKICKEGEDYKVLTIAEIKRLQEIGSANVNIPEEITEGNRSKHIIIDPDSFKESLMMINTNRAKQVRKYYVRLERVYKQYVEYCLNAANTQIEESKKSADTFKMMILNKSTYMADQYVYIATTRSYAKKNIFKVGCTTRLEKRMSGYQTGRSSDDKYCYVYLMKCVDSRAMEQLIFTRLKQFAHEDNKELFQIHLETLKSIIDTFARFEMESVDTLNRIVLQYYDKYQTMEVLPFDDIIISNMDDYIEDKFEITRADRYVPNTDSKPSPLSLTTDTVCYKLAGMGLKLIGEYPGSETATIEIQCSSPLKHRFESSYGYLRGLPRCPYCGKDRILDKVPIYEYTDRDYNYVNTYESFDALKEAKPELNHQLLKNIIREQRWLTAHEGHVYSILAPYENTLDLNKPLTDAELFMIDIIGINYAIMRARICQSVLRYCLAIDDQDKIVYTAKSYTEMARHLRQKDKTSVLNRKTISKYLNSAELYGGYRYVISGAREYRDYRVIDVTTL